MATRTGRYVLVRVHGNPTQQGYPGLTRQESDAIILCGREGI
jgi:hypothetical protein